MESVNLEMEDLFEEEAADEDDFPSVGPLPDLPEREEGGAEGGDDEGTDVMSKLQDLSKGAAKKVVRKPLPKLDAQRLTGERGIPILPKVFEKVQLKGKGHEAQDLRIIMRYLEHWSHRLFPMMPFDEVLERIEKLGTKKEVQTCIKKMRLDMPLLNEDYILDSDNEEEENGEKDKTKLDKNDVDPVDEAEWDEIIREHEEEQKMSQASQSSQQETSPISQLKTQLSKPLLDLKSQSQPYTASPVPSSSSGGGLTPEQRERIERNRQLALQKKLGKGFKTPAVPPLQSPFSSQKLSSTQSSTYNSSHFSPSTSLTSKTSHLSSMKIRTTSQEEIERNNDSITNFEFGENKLSYESTQDLSQIQQKLSQEMEIVNGDITNGESDMSEVIPLLGQSKEIKDKSKCTVDSEEMSEVIPNQKEIKNTCLEQNMEVNDEVTEDEILSSFTNN